MAGWGKGIATWGMVGGRISSWDLGILVVVDRIVIEGRGWKRGCVIATHVEEPYLRKHTIYVRGFSAVWPFRSFRRLSRSHWPSGCCVLKWRIWNRFSPSNEKAAGWRSSENIF
jgi:hypothetical protein